MFLAEKTVKNYVSRLLSKLGMQRRTQAAVLATEIRGSATGSQDQRPYDQALTAGTLEA